MSGFVDWLQHSTLGLLLLALAGIAVLLLMIIRWRAEPFVALLVIGLLTALAAGVPVRAVVRIVRNVRGPHVRACIEVITTEGTLNYA